MLPNFFPIMSLVLVNYKVKNFYQIIGVVGLWYGMAWSSRVGNSFFSRGGGGCFFQMMSDFFGFLQWVYNHAPSPLLNNIHNPRATSHPRALVRASSSVLPLAYQKAHPLETTTLSPLQPTPTHENAVLLKKVLYLNTTIKCLKSH